MWAVGETDDPVKGGRALVERWDEGTWKTVDLPTAGSTFTSLWGVAAAGDQVWAVGTYWDTAFGDNVTLNLHGGEDGWRVDSGPNPGTGANVLGGVAVAGDNVWAVGYYKDNGRKTLIERHRAG